MRLCTKIRGPMVLSHCPGNTMVTQSFTLNWLKKRLNISKTQFCHLQTSFRPSLDFGQLTCKFPYQRDILSNYPSWP